MIIEPSVGAEESPVDGVGVGVAVTVLVVNDNSLPYDVPPLLLAAMR